MKRWKTVLSIFLVICSLSMILTACQPKEESQDEKPSYVDFEWSHSEEFIHSLQSGEETMLYGVNLSSNACTDESFPLNIVPVFDPTTVFFEEYVDPYSGKVEKWLDPDRLRFGVEISLKDSFHAENEEYQLQVSTGYENVSSFPKESFTSDEYGLAILLNESLSSSESYLTIGSYCQFTCTVTQNEKQKTYRGSFYAGVDPGAKLFVSAEYYPE